MAKEDHYKDKYGGWAGNPHGHKPDYTQCCEEVHGAGCGDLFYQCTRKAKYGPDGAYCKQHESSAVEARKKAGREKYEAERRAERPKWYAKPMFEALKAIAAGHNDPRSLAADLVKKIDGD